MTNIESNKKIIKNTTFLYIRMLITMLVNLYISRIVLNILGVVDFGIYNVVGGIVMLFSFINSAMAVGTQRFLSYELGKNNSTYLRTIFSTSIVVHISVALIAFILLETIGLWYLNNYIKIPINREDAAKWVYHLSVITFILIIIRVPFNALIISYEQMSAYALFSIVEVASKLILVFFVYKVSLDKLIAYSSLILLITLIVNLMYFIYCYLKIKECRYKYYFDKFLYFKLISYSGWNTFGAVATIGNSYGINLLINLFGGITLNAAYGIAFQIRSAIMNFSNNFQTAMNPQIIKSYSSKDYNYMQNIIYNGAKYSFFLLYLFSLPVLITTPLILKLWLGIVPNYTITFSRFMLAISLIDCISGTLMTASQASGKIKIYQIIISIIILTNLPVSYLFLKYGYKPDVVFITGIIISTISLFTRIYLVSKLVPISFKKYTYHVLLNIILVVATSIIPLLIIYDQIENNLVLTIFTSMISSLLSIYFIGLNKREKEIIKNIFIKNFTKIVFKLKNAFI